MMDTNVARSGSGIDYYHFDFHGQCHENSDPMLEFLKGVVMPLHMEQIGLFV